MLIILGLVKLKKIIFRDFHLPLPRQVRVTFFLTNTISITYESFSNVNEPALSDRFTWTIIWNRMTIVSFNNQICKFVYKLLFKPKLVQTKYIQPNLM